MSYYNLVSSNLTVIGLIESEHRLNCAPFQQLLSRLIISIRFQFDFMTVGLRFGSFFFFSITGIVVSALILCMFKVAMMIMLKSTLPAQTIMITIFSKINVSNNIHTFHMHIRLSTDI